MDWINWRKETKVDNEAVSEKMLEQILARKTKGAAFRSYPNEQGYKSYQEYMSWERHKLAADNASLGQEAFKLKYAVYIY